MVNCSIPEEGCRIAADIQELVRCADSVDEVFFVAVQIPGQTIAEVSVRTVVVAVMLATLAGV